MKTTLKLIIALMLAGAGIGQTWAKLRENPIGHITYSRGDDDHGELRFFNDQDLTKQLTTGTALDANGLEAEKDGEGHVVGYRVYVCATPDLGYTVKDMTLQAELTTNAMQAHRRLHGGDATFDTGQTLTLTPVEDMPYVYTMVMPDDPNLSVSVTAKFAEKAKNTAAINYIDADGTTKTKAIGSVYVLDGTEENLGYYTEEKGTWYVCNSTLDFKHHIYLWTDGDIHLILADGAKMSVEDKKYIDAFSVPYGTLTIYGQSMGSNMGSLTATGVSIGIGGNGSVTINGGEVTATGYYGIGAQNVTINGGKVTATATDENGYGIYGGDITLGWNSATGSINATSYGIYGTGSVKTTDGKVLKYTDGNSQTVKLMGTLDADAIAAIAGKELTPYGYGGYCGKDDTETTDADESKNVTWEIPLVNGAPGSTLTISGTGDMADYKNDDTSEEGNFAPWLKPNADGDASDGLKYESVTVVNITDGVTSVSHKAFDGCDDLKLILVPNEEAYDAYYNGSGWGTYKAKLAPQTMTVAKNASGWGTYCHRFPVSYSLSEGATAYTVTGLSQDGKSVSMAQAADNHVTPETPLLLNYTAPDEDTETDDENVTLTAVPATATTVSGDDIVSHGNDGFTFSGNTTGSTLKHAADNDGIPVLTGVEGLTSYALYNGTFLRIDSDNGIDGHRCVLTVSGNASPEVIALSAAVVTPGEDGGIGHITYSQGEDEHGTLRFFNDQDLTKQLTTGENLNPETLELEAVKDGNTVVGYRIYVGATPDFGYTVKDMTLQAELTTTAQQARRHTATADAPTLQVGRSIELTPVEDMPYVYTMVMPNDPNLSVSITAKFAEKAKNTAAISYIDTDGSTKTKAIGSVYVLDGTETTLGKSGSETWYVCNSTTGLAYASTLALDGNVHLVLADGTAMSAATISGSGKTLNIYAQPGQTGQMLADAYQCNVSFGQRFVAYIDEASASAIVSGKNTDASPSFTLADINGKTLKPLDGYTVTAAGGISIVGKNADFTITKDANTTTYYIYKASTQQAPVSVTLNYGGQGLVTLGGLPDGTSPNAVANQPMQRSFAMPAEDVALTTTAVTGLAANGTYNYDGTAQTPAINLGDDVFDAANYTVSSFTAKQGSALTDGTAVNAGSYTVTITGLGQYIGTASVDFTIGKVDYDGTKTALVNVYSNQATTDETLTLLALPDGASYAATGTVGGNNSGLISGTPSVSGTTLTYSTTAQETGASATITIGVTGATNYNDYEVVVTVTVIDKDDAGVTINGGEDKTVKFGDADFTLAKTVTDAGSGTGTWTWTSSDTDVATVGESTGTITIKKTGSTTIKAQYESESTKGEATMTLTVEAKDIDYANGTITLDENGYTVNLDEDNGSANTLPDDAELVNLTYKRTLTAPGTNKGDITIDDKAARLYTVCLPFAPITGTAVKYYTLSSVDGPVLHFDEVATPVANTPYLVAVFGNANFTENCTDVDITSTAINSTTVDGYTFNGTFTGLSHAKAVGKYILQPDSKWRQVESSGTVKIPPFRAYIEAQTNAPDLMDGTVGGNVTGIDSIRMTDADGTEHWYDLNGRRVSKPATKGIYIRGGKKVVVK